MDRCALCSKPWVCPACEMCAAHCQGGGDAGRCRAMIESALSMADAPTWNRILSTGRTSTRKRVVAKKARVRR